MEKLADIHLSNATEDAVTKRSIWAL